MPQFLIVSVLVGEEGSQVAFHAVVSSNHSQLAGGANLSLQLVVTASTHGMTENAMHNPRLMCHVLKADRTFWIHKPNFLPWSSFLIFIKLILQSFDCILDTIQPDLETVVRIHLQLFPHLLNCEEDLIVRISTLLVIFFHHCACRSIQNPKFHKP